MAEARITFHPDRRGIGTVRITETHWGAILRDAPGALGGAAIAEAGVRFLGLVLVLAAYVQWLLPASLFPGDVVTNKIVLTAGLTVTGAGLYLAAGLGFQSEVQVDTVRRELRIARRNRRGAARVIRRIAFEDVESIHLRRHEGGAAEAVLRLKGEEARVCLAKGAERDVARVHARLCRDLKSPAERVEARLKAIEPQPRPPVRIRLRRSA